MTPVTRSAVRPGAYYDSVVLMRLQAALAALPDIRDAGVVMGTPANLELLAASGLLAEGRTEVGPNDLLIAVQAESEAAAAEALSRVDALLQMRRSEGLLEEYRPRSLASAVKQIPEAQWVLISVPGRYAAEVAREALELGKNIFLYSDNVTVEQEMGLKEQALASGLMVMGPDCGTALIGGVGLGFANRVGHGAIGLVAASGTGLQAVTSRIDALGAGVSQAIGTGGRDLSEAVGGITAAQALDLLRRDPETLVIVLISKPPSTRIASRLLALARAAGKPVVVHFLGAPLPARRLGNVHFVAGLAEAAERAVECLGGEMAEVSRGTAVGEARDGGAETPFAPGQRWVRGLFSGGTLAHEVLLGLSAALEVSSNLLLTQTNNALDRPGSSGHAILDLGADEFTVGRLHPMIDFDLRLRRLRQEVAAPEVAVILLDVVLGDGAHADPAGELAPAIERCREEARAAGRRLEVGVLVIGTERDPQDLSLQISTLEQAGARVVQDVDALLDFALARLDETAQEAAEPGNVPVTLDVLASPLAAINVGLESFYDSLVAQGARAVQVEWQPPAGGDERLAGILARLRGR
jgi:FdrA protein